MVVVTDVPPADVNPSEVVGGNDDQVVLAGLEAVGKIHVPAPNPDVVDQKSDAFHTDEETEDTVSDTPLLDKRKRAPALKSPFVDFGSADVGSTPMELMSSGSQSAEDDRDFKMVTYVKGLYALNDAFADPVSPEIEAKFDAWIGEGLLKHPRKRAPALKSPFVDFGSVDVGSTPMELMSSGSQSVGDDRDFKMVTYVKGLYALNDAFADPVSPEIEAKFDAWIGQDTLDDIEEETSFWNSSLVCYIGANPPLNVLDGFVRRLWKDKIDKVGLLSYGIFLIRFHEIDDRESVLNGGYIFFNKRPVIMKAWDPNVDFKKEDVRQIGEPIIMDAVTKKRDKLSYPRVLIEVLIEAIKTLSDSLP
ncbi:hypothetical protein F8388_023069 [Cannabis sativa]|uniref:DUF4283 domain-containing protein n=1 Tax=Cannabis sativa TaxID=3483 RepID=A0A7J6FEX0_CANSA|nr:hypothetical protein F8388_023069 [Cannabis sativa]KAF4397822.1 hypothetical protein G4B88_017303 [Cannabis sativa]